MQNNKKKSCFLEIFKLRQNVFGNKQKNKKPWKMIKLLSPQQFCLWCSNITWLDKTLKNNDSAFHLEIRDEAQEDYSFLIIQELGEGADFTFRLFKGSWKNIE